MKSFFDILFFWDQLPRVRSSRIFKLQSIGDRQRLNCGNKKKKIVAFWSTNNFSATANFLSIAAHPCRINSYGTVIFN